VLAHEELTESRNVDVAGGHTAPGSGDVTSW
jgi:hypothetical protein